jgi:flagellar biosynthetic protein FliQ
MNEGTVIALMRETVMTTLMLALPLLAVSLVVGLAVSLFQAVTQISEMTLTFVPKLLGIIAVLVILGPWMLHRLLSFTQWLFAMLPEMAH